MLCSGKNNHRNSHKTEWYAFYNKPVSKDTRCSYCYNNIKQHGHLDARSMYKYTGVIDMIDCDSLYDMDIAGMQFKKFNFKITNIDSNTPRLVYPPKAHDRENGLLVVEMPETDEYMVHIEPPSDIYGFLTGNYYTFEMYVGGRKVIVNNDMKIFYNSKIRISGFETGKLSNFKFVADTANGGNSSAPVNSNIITIKITEYKKISTHRRDVALFNNQPSDNYVDYLTSSYRSMDRANCSTDSFGLTGNNKFETSYSIYNDRTESGNKYVDNIKTRPTNDEFQHINGFTVTIQLIHVPTPHTNLPIDSPAAIEIAYIDQRIKDIEQEQQQLRELQKKLLLTNSVFVQPVTQQPVPNTPIMSHTAPVPNTPETSPIWSIFQPITQPVRSVLQPTTPIINNIPQESKVIQYIPILLNTKLSEELLKQLIENNQVNQPNMTDIKSIFGYNQTNQSSQTTPSIEQTSQTNQSIIDQIMFNNDTISPDITHPNATLDITHPNAIPDISHPNTTLEQKNYDVDDFINID